MMQTGDKKMLNLTGLNKKLSDYADRAPVRFHMPGHKGKPVFIENKELKYKIPYEIDVTEIDGMDDLYSPGGAILKIQNDLVKYYNVKAARLLVNGSTVGILASIFAMTKEGDRILISRNSHKSVYHGLMLRKVKPVYLSPRIDKFGITSPIESDDVERALKVYPDIKLVILTSPTYEGVVLNIKDIKSRLDEKKIPLLIDAAHGAHLPHLGDISVTSLHKTLPFLTQTSCIRISEDAKRYIEKIDQYLSCFQSSSPSYILMGAADLGIEYLLSDGKSKFKELNENLSYFYEKAKALNNINLFDEKKHDRTKIVIKTPGANALDYVESVLKKNNISFEMKTPGYILCMASIMDEKEDFERLYEALFEADKELKGNFKEAKIRDFPWTIPAKTVLAMDKAIEKPSKMVDLTKAIGLVSAGFIDMFPPGIPIVVPGEQIEKEHINLVKNAKEHNINIRGIIEGKISVI